MLSGDVAIDVMNRNALVTVLVAGLVLLAGCSSGLTGSQDESATEESALDGQATAETIEGETGTVNMYISDEENAISDFEHLNVTITRVGVKPAGDGGGDDDGADDAEEGDDSDTDDDGTETVANGDTDSDGTDEDANTTESVETPDADGADDGDATESAEEDDTESDAEDAAESAEEDDAEADEDDEGDGEWVEYEVDNRTVDLTELKGKNATKLSSLEVPNGTYEKVFVYVSDVDGTLKDGSDQRVKLPSGKLQLNSEFTVGDGEEVDFVFDITAVKAGNSGKYILKPVISESGTDVEIEDVDERDEDEDERDEERGADGSDEDRGSELNASFDSDVVAGANVTLRVTQDGEPVEGATVFVDGERAGTTDAAGNHAIEVPGDTEELEVTVRHADAAAELEVALDGESGSEDSDTEESDTDGADADQQTNETADESQHLTVG
jgi:hypothetical protein